MDGALSERLATAELHHYRGRDQKLRRQVIFEGDGWEVFADMFYGVPGLIKAGKLDEAEQTTRNMLAQFPDDPYSYDRLGMVCEARGEFQKAADCYRKALEAIRQNPEAFAEGGIEEEFVAIAEYVERLAGARVSLFG
jgi:tetratricopeptide (TPR) repeat protein